MRILLVSDLHYALRQLDWIVDAADGFDVVVLAGDHLDVGSSVPLDAQIEVVLRYVDRIGAASPVIICSGNHDLDGVGISGEREPRWIAAARGRALAADGQGVTVDATRFTVSPWWDGPRARSEVGSFLREEARHRAERWVWVYHTPPTSACAWTGRRHVGDDALDGWITELRPDLVLTGHVHEAPFKPDGDWLDRVGSTWIVNAGRQLGPVPCHVELDLGTGRATWHSLAGVERRTVMLDAQPGDVGFLAPTVGGVPRPETPPPAAIATRARAPVDRPAHEEHAMSDAGTAAASEPVPEALVVTAGLPERRLAAGEVLLHEGDPPGSVHVLVDGMVEVRRAGTVLTRVSRPGAWLGEMSMLLDVPATATVVAVAPTTVRTVTDPRGMLAWAPAIALDLARVLARRLHALNAYVVDLAAQLEGSADHLAMLDAVVGAITHAPAGAAEAGSERDPEPMY